MPSHKIYFPVIASILFLISATMLYTNVIVIPPDAGQEYFMDKVFYNGSLILFYLSTPYLLNLIIKKILWKAEFKNSIGASTIGLVEDLTIVSVYLISFGVLFTKLFSTKLSLTLILISIAVALIVIYIRPKLLKYSKAGFVVSTRPFKVGDWISLINQNGSNYLTGKVIGFDNKCVKLKSENNSLLILPNHMLTNFVIENYKSLSQVVQFNIHFTLTSQIPVEQAKRILTAATMHSLNLIKNNADQSIEVLLTKVSGDYSDYKINYSLNPWESFSPDQMKDQILSRILEHLKVAGLEVNNIKPEYNPIQQVELFNSLNKEDLTELAAVSRNIIFKKGEEIIKQGNSGESMFVLQEGLLSVKISANQNEELNVGIISPGQFFGEMSLFTGEERSATVITLTDSCVIEITKDALKNILNKKPKLINAFSEVIVERQNINLKMMDDYLNKKETFIKKLTSKIKSFFEM